MELKGEAEEQVQNADWIVWNGHHWCENCRPVCSACGHSFEEHDYGEADCGYEYDPVGDCPCQAFTVEDE